MLKVSPCRQLCDWAPATGRHGRPPSAEQLFACRGCGSEWVRSEPWTPAQADGTLPEVVLRERQRG